MSGSTRILLLGAALLSSGCDGTRITDSGEVEDIRLHVVGAAADNLNADGYFQFPAPLSPSALPIISAERARALAEADIRTFGSQSKAEWERLHGRAINLSALKADPRVLYVPTPYALFPDGFHLSYRREYGPYYLVRLKAENTTVLLVCVSAYASEVQIDVQGFVQRPGLGRGAEFFEHAIPKDTSLVRLFTAEEAVVLVGSLTSVRVSEVPELVRRGAPLSPAAALWKLTLERPVSVRTVQGSRTLETSELYVSLETRARILIPSPVQPTSQATMALRVGPDGVSTEMDSLSVPIIKGAPTVFEPVVLDLRR